MIEKNREQFTKNYIFSVPLVYGKRMESARRQKFPRMPIAIG